MGRKGGAFTDKDNRLQKFLQAVVFGKEETLVIGFVSRVRLLEGQPRPCPVTHAAGQVDDVFVTQV